MAQGIYKIINTANNKFYVGSTNHTKVRFREHRKQLRGKRHHCKHLQAAWNKYGEDAFVFVLVQAVADTKDLFAAEEKWLREHHGETHCYNSGRSANAPYRGCPKEDHPAFGRPKSDSERAAISQKLKAYYAEAPENHPRFGTMHTEETKAKISAKRKGKTAGDAHYRYGQVVSEEVRQKIGDTQRGIKKAPRVVSEEGKAKIAAAAAAGHYNHWEGKHHTEESKQRMSKRVIEITNNMEFNSLTAVLEHYGMTMPTLRRALVSDKPITKGKFAGLWFRYRGMTFEDTTALLARLSKK